MRKFLRSFIALQLVIMSMSSTVFAQVDVKVKVDGSEVAIDGTSDHALQNVMIQTWNGDTKYYIDADKTDVNGKFNFKFKTKENLDYSGKVNVGGELKDFQFSTKDSSSEIKVESVKFNKNNLEIKEGKSEKLEVTITPENATNKKLIFKSSDEKVATVDKSGEVKGVKEGKAEIEVATKDGNKKDKCIVVVTKRSSGGSGGGGGASFKPGKEDKNLDELKKELNSISLTGKELNIEKIGDKEIVTVDEHKIASKLKEAENIIKTMKEKNKELKLSEDVKNISIKISDDSNKNTILRLNKSGINYLKDKEFGIKLSFKDSEINLPYNKIKNVNLYENVEVRKNAVKDNVKREVINSMSSENKIVSPVYNIELYKIDDHKKEEKLDMKGTKIGVKINNSDLKNISKNSLKINFYDSKEKKFVALKSKYVAEANMVVSEVK
ncbi:Ig-like domain-containing protein [Clostridium lundense]|uniref:Ig-like domain-containing protein n=1 Tax=Clostridium lundense TaxID=319475 RepID=UPI00068558A7|nr:Ig-like domain-containing protein [Clostridium lundense]